MLYVFLFWIHFGLEGWPITPGQYNARNMTGQDLHALILEKWGHSFDVQLRKTQGKIFVQVMWRYLEQASFPMTEAEYMAHLDEVANYIEGWGNATQVQTYLEQTQERPRLGKAVNIPIDLGGRASEWLVE